MARGADTIRARNVAYKCAAYGIILFILGVAQVSFFSKIRILGATPDLLLGATLAIAMLEDQRSASICGIVAGFVYHSLGGFGYPIYILFSFFCAYVFHILSNRILGKNYFSFLVLATLIYGAKAVFNIVDAILFSNSFNVFALISRVLLPEFISSMVFCTVSYLIIFIPNKLINRKNKSRKEQMHNER